MQRTYARAQLFTETQVGAKDGKSEDSFGTDPSDNSQVSKVKGLIFLETNQIYTCLKRIRIVIPEQIVLIGARSPLEGEVGRRRVTVQLLLENQVSFMF